MILDSVSHLLPGTLPASFRGVGFFVPDTTTNPGRRVAEHLFPGRDFAAYDDMGLAPAKVTVEGLMVGDDYVAQAAALQAAFERPGPGTLVHPWLGAMTVILAEPAEISFSARELRVARFSATFTRLPAAAALGFVSTGVMLIEAAFALATAVGAFAARASVATASQVRTLAAQRAQRETSAAWSAASASWPELRRSLPASASSPAAFAAGLASIQTAVLAAVPELTAPAAVAPSAEATAPAGLAVRDALAISLAAHDALAAGEPPSDTDRALMAAAAGSALAIAARLAASVDYASRSDARDVCALVTTRLDAWSAACHELAETAFAAAASDAIRAAAELRRRLAADINEVIGRLPETVVFQATRETDAFQLANHLYGDDPGEIEAGYRIILSRNRPRHPAQLPAGPIEALK